MEDMVLTLCWCRKFFTQANGDNKQGKALLEAFNFPFRR